MDNNRAQTSFDAAALATATLAAAIPIFTKPGPYDWLPGILGVTLLLVVLAYERRRYRDGWQTIAFGAAVAFPGLLLFGLLAEKLLEWQKVPLGKTLTGEPDSRVPTTWTVFAWVVIAAVCAGIDRWSQVRHAPRT